MERRRLADAGGAGGSGGIDSAGIRLAPGSGPTPGGSAGQGEVLILSDAEIERLGTNSLQRTLRSLEGPDFSSNVNVAE